MGYALPRFHCVRKWEVPRGVMANKLDCEIVVCEFELSRTITFRFELIPLGKV